CCFLHSLAFKSGDPQDNHGQRLLREPLLSWQSAETRCTVRSAKTCLPSVAHSTSDYPSSSKSYQPTRAPDSTHSLSLAGISPLTNCPAADPVFCVFHS
ncbi:hypothetical protein AMECASPLE_018483, partial [Ameca splendens]